MSRRRFPVDPYFLAGLLAAVLLGAGFVWKTRSPRVVVLDRVPDGLLAKLDAVGIAYARGDAESPVHVVEISDYQCPACATAHRTTEATLKRFINAGLARYTAYDVPLPAHTNAFPASLLVHCAHAGNPEVGWSVRDALYTKQPEWAEAYPVEPVLLRLADGAGADTAAARDCMNREGAATMSRLRAAREAVSATGINFTPLWLVNDKAVRWDQLGREIELAIAGQ